MIDYKLIALDVDGTLVNSRLELSPATRSALIRIQRDKGVRVAIASGRPTPGLRHLVEELELNKYGGYILPFNGGEIFDARDLSQPIKRTSLPSDIIPELYDLSREHGLTILTYTADEILTERPDDPKVHKEMALTVMPARRVENFVQEVPKHLTKCLIVGEPEQIKALQPIARARFAGRVDAFTSDPCFLELVPSGINKGVALAGLLKNLEINPKEMIAVGDGHNDIEMIELAGLGVAMANAREAVRERADYITKSNDEDGIAHLVQFLLPE